jgi:hypothetical protein
MTVEVRCRGLTDDLIVRQQTLIGGCQLPLQPA